ncbi:CAP domain-containing protein [Streptomyces sp. NPDC048506]|uniref:CAP domain-containing protein n=1 Tax=Streptomyces sp. NPDC048506 TaxID=3155028 RepID=UPI00343A8840
MNHDDSLRPALRDETPDGTGHRTGASATSGRHAATRSARRPARNGGSHRADATRPRSRTALLTAAAVITVGGSCLVLIRTGSGADQVLAADPSVPARPTVASSVPPASSSASHSPRRHKASPTASDTERPGTPHASSGPRTADAEKHSRPAHRTTPRAPHVESGTGAPAGPRAATGTAADFAQKVVDLVNAQRAQHGCGPLTVDRRIQKAAQAHSDDMAARNYYAHDTPEGVDPGTRMTNAGFRWQSWAENIFKSPKDPATAVDGWMDSPGHRDNILNCSYKVTGVGVNLSSNGPWWTQDFATGS